MFNKTCLFIAAVGAVLAFFTHGYSLLLIPMAIVLMLFKLVWSNGIISIFSRLMWTFLIVGLITYFFEKQLGIKILLGAAICLIINLFRWIFIGCN